MTQTSLMIAGFGIVIGGMALSLLLRNKASQYTILWCLPFSLVLTASYGVNLAWLWDGTLYGSLKSDQCFELASRHSR